MSDKARVFFLSLTIVAMLVFSAVGTTTVFADDGTSTGTTDTNTTSEEQPVDTTSTDQTATSSPTEGLPPEEASPLLEQLPENTTVEVIDAAGETQPIVSQDSAETILLSDPIWCPEGQSPTPGMNGCTASYSSFTDLLNFLKTNESDAAYQQAGTIYVQQGAYLGGESSIDFNTYNFTNLNQHNLTIHGGWDTVDNSLDTADTSTFNIPIIIGSSSNPWAGSLTLNNLTINNAGGQAGITLYSEDNISLSNIEVTGSTNGANLNAVGDVTVTNSKFNKNKGTGADITAGGSVNVSNSEFNENGSSANAGKGLNVKSGASVSLASIQANNNQVFGATINATGEVSINNSFFSGNKAYTSTCKSKTLTGGYGLKVITTAPITATGITANDNYLFGASLDGANVSVFDGYFNNNGSGTSGNPAGKGLEVISDNDVTLISVQANNNQIYGANIQANGSVTVISSFFDGNKSYTYSCKGSTYNGYGLSVVTTGSVFLSQVSASSNNLFGAHLEGAGVFISNGTFSNNGNDSGKSQTGKGLEITSASDVTLSNVQANNNQLFGANIQAVGGVVISNSFFNGHKSYTYSSCSGKKVTGGYGLQVVAGNDISLYTVEASDNYLYGAKLSGANVSITTASFNNNGSGSIDNPVGYGLDIKSTGNVSLAYIEANDNQLSGATIQSTGNVSVTNAFFNGNKSYTYSSCKGKTYYGYGLQVVTTQSISLNNVSANENYLYGAHLEGTDTSISFSTFDSNGTGKPSEPVGKGLEVVSSAGQVSLYEVSGSNNQLFGANIVANGFVSVSNSVFSGNLAYTSGTCQSTKDYGYGIKVVTTNDVNMIFVTANDNRLFGASVSGVNVNVANSSFNHNTTGSDKNPQGKGLDVTSTGSTWLYDVDASYNQLFGANVQSQGDVTVTGSLFAGNNYATSNGYGLKVYANGNILLNSGNEAYDNGANGALLEGWSNITVEDSSFHNNGASGLYIKAHDTDVTLTNVTATNNGVDGVDVESACSNVVYVNGGTFADNAQYGIKVINASMSMDGTQTFSNNTSGNIFSNRTTCFVSTGNNGNNNSSNNSSQNNGGHSNHGGNSNNGDYGQNSNHGNSNGHGSHQNGHNRCR